MTDPISIGVGQSSMEGLSPGKMAPSELDFKQQLGEAPGADVVKFKEAMFKAPGMEAAELGQQGNKVQGSPFDIQSNRIRRNLGDLSNKRPRVDSSGLGDRLAQGITNIMKVNHSQEAQLMEKLNANGDKGWSAADAIQVQFMVGNLQLMTEIFSKGVNKTVQGMQQAARNQ